MQKLPVFVAFAILISVVHSLPTFTGNAIHDFQASALTIRDIASYHKFNNTDPVNVIPYMANSVPPRRSGIDIDAIHMVYDDASDTMYVGVECAAICGDVDGDGNPSGVDPAAPVDSQRVSILGADSPNLCNTEQFSLMFWNNVPTDYDPLGQNPFFFFPTMVVGVDFLKCLVNNAGTQQFLAYEWPSYQQCKWPIPRDQPAAQCVNDTRRRVQNPGAPNVYTPRILSEMWKTNSSYRVVSKPDFWTLYPNITNPHLEFKLANFSHYPEFDFVPGYGKMRLALNAAAGSSADKNGEDLVRSEVWELAWDCEHWPGGVKTYDACGVCGGDNTTCWDCAHIPNGPALYDACGVCDGDNTTCWDCDHKPNGHKRYDACGVCDGDNTTCWDCAHKPNGPKRYDACGVCGGNNQTCWDCAHIPNGPKRYDACGVCNGNNRTCWDCDHKPNGPKRYDACGVCDGDNTTCWDCEHIPNGPARYDACGVCDGNNQTCWDCAHKPNGKKVYDVCGVCGGNNRTCWDCFHIPNGNATYDRHGICGGNGTADCFDDPYGHAVYDNCGVCGGDGTSCECIEYLGYDLSGVDYALLRWTISASMFKINDTLEVLRRIRHQLPGYDYQSGEVSLEDYIDHIHEFTDNCLDNFDYAQLWFAEYVAGACTGLDCKNPVKDNYLYENHKGNNHEDYWTLE